MVELKYSELCFNTIQGNLQTKTRLRPVDEDWKLSLTYIASHRFACIANAYH